MAVQVEVVAAADVVGHQVVEVQEDSMAAVAVEEVSEVAVALVVAVGVLTIVSSDQVVIDPTEEVVRQCKRHWLLSSNHFLYLYITFTPVPFNLNIRPAAKFASTDII